MARYMERHGLPDGTEELIDGDSIPNVTRRTGGPALTYPRALIEAGINGWVVVAFIVTPEGQPSGVRIMASSQVEFEPPTLAVIRGSTYQPPTLEGRSVSVFMCQRVSYTLERR